MSYDGYIKIMIRHLAPGPRGGSPHNSFQMASDPAKKPSMPTAPPSQMPVPLGYSRRRLQSHTPRWRLDVQQWYPCIASLRSLSWVLPSSYGR